MSASIFCAEAFASEVDVFTWAGFCPWTGTHIFGTEQGQLAVPVPGNQLRAGKRPHQYRQATADAVNGVAFHGDTALVTSPRDVALITKAPGHRSITSSHQTLHRWGAHGVTVGPAGAFYLLRGKGGLAWVTMDRRRVRTREFASPQIDLYKPARVAPVGEADVLAVAARRNGMAVVRCEGEERPEVSLITQFEAIDLVDVASVGRRELPRAVVGLGADGRLCFLTDTLDGGYAYVAEPVPHPKQPNIAYSIRVVGGVGLILSDAGITCLPRLAEGLVKSDPSRLGEGAFFFPVEAADIYATGVDGFAVLEEPRVSIFRIQDFVHSDRTPGRRGARRRAAGGRPVRFARETRPVQYATARPPARASRSSRLPAALEAESQLAH